MYVKYNLINNIIKKIHTKLLKTCNRMFLGDHSFLVLGLGAETDRKFNTVRKEEKE